MSTRTRDLVPVRVGGGGILGGHAGGRRCRGRFGAWVRRHHAEGGRLREPAELRQRRDWRAAADQAFQRPNEIKGVKLSWTEFADDKQDPATALSEERRLVTQEGVFAIVGDVSNINGSYLQQQHVPYFGWALRQLVLQHEVDTGIYGFGFNGCVVPQRPKVMSRHRARRRTST